MLMDKWTKHGENPIFSPRVDKWDRFIEDFVVVKMGKKYYAFYCGGGSYESLSGIGVAISDSPIGPFSRTSNSPVIRGGHMRMGSVIRVGKKWKMYFSRMKGDVFVADLEGVGDWTRWVERTEPVARNIIQPCVQRFGKRYLMLATDMKEKGIVALWSDDGLRFRDEKKIMVMKPDSLYEFGISNPSFVVKQKKIHILFEGRQEEFTRYCGKVIGNWRVFGALWDGMGEVKITDEPVLKPSAGRWDEAQVANPHITKFGNRHYLYYGGWGKKSRFDVGVAWRDI